MGETAQWPSQEHQWEASVSGDNWHHRYQGLCIPTGTFGCCYWPVWELRMSYLDVPLGFIFTWMSWSDMKGWTLLINEMQSAAKILMSHSWLLVWRASMCTNYIMMEHPHWHVTTLLLVHRAQLGKNEPADSLIHHNEVNYRCTNYSHNTQRCPWAPTLQ